jgi:hypothetical protein
MKMKKVITIILALIMVATMPLMLIGCSNDDSNDNNGSPNRQTDSSSDAASGSENGDTSGSETGQQALPVGLTIEFEELALSVGRISGIVNLSRPLEASAIHHLDETISGRNPVRDASRTVILDEFGEWVWEEYEFKIYGDFEGFESISLRIRNEYGEQVGFADIGRSGSSEYRIFDSSNYQISPLSWMFDGELWVDTAGTFTIDYSLRYNYDISEVDEAQQYSHTFHSIERWYEQSIMEFECNPQHLAINCDYIELGGRMYSPFIFGLRLSRFGADNHSNEDLRLLGYFPFLEALSLSHLGIDDITPIAELTNLKILGLEGNTISDLTPLAGLTNLITLNLENNGISDLTPLAGLTNLITLNLASNGIINVSPLARLTNLESLNLSNQREIVEYTDEGSFRWPGTGTINDLTPLADLTNLKELLLINLEINDISQLAGLTNLIYLYLDYSQLITSFAPLSELSNLEVLSLENTHIVDLSPLANLTNLRWLNIRSNDISDWSPIDHVVDVEGRP